MPYAIDSSETTPLRAVPLAIERISGFLKIADVLIAAGRHIDLSGFEAEIGRLCAMVLDLDPAAGRALRPRLGTLAAELDTLEARLTAVKAAPPA